MALTKQELEEINEKLQVEIERRRWENERLAEALSSANKRMEKLGRRYARLVERYRTLRAYVRSLRAWASEYAKQSG